MRLLDQRALPARLRFLVCRDVDVLIDAIATLAVRGAPALGRGGRVRGRARGAHAADEAPGARGRGAHRAGAPDRGEPRVGSRRAVSTRTNGAVATARSPRREAIAADDVARNRRIGAHGAGARAGRRCGAHALQHGRARVRRATAPRSASCAPRSTRAGGRAVWVDETRPLLQGARLTMWECDAARHRRDARSPTARPRR